MVPAANNNFFIAASMDDVTMIALADKNMEVIWATSMDLGAGVETILDMRMDTDGNLIGVGNTNSSIIQCFAFKIAANGLLIWRSRLNDPGNSYFTRILEKNSGANYLLFGQTDLVGTGNDSGCDALLMEINRNTGQLLWDRQYDLGSCELINDVFIENNQIYTCGRYNLVNGGQSRFRGAMSLFDTDGNVNWSRHYLRNNQDARLYFSSLAHENDGLVAFGYGDDGGTSLTATTLQLVKTDLTGVANWAKEYDIVGGNEERSTKLFSLSDGYLLFGNFVRQTVASREICLLKTDKQGNLLWGKTYGALGEDRVSDVILLSDTIYLIGGRQNAQIFDILIGKMDLNGDVDGQCDFVKSLDVTVSDYTAPLDFSHNLVEIDITHNYATASLPVQTEENNVVTEVICQKICDDSCDKPDASVTIDSIFCWEGQTVIFLRIHNTGFAQYPANSMLSFYDADPTSSAANLLRTMLIPFAIDTGTALSVEIFDGHTFLLTNSNFVLYAVVNDDGSLPTPFSLDSFPQTGIEECGYTNNVGSRPFTTSGVLMLDLGPDVSLCANDILVMQAGAGFYQYQWQDGSSDSTFLINASGTYWVEVTDECGYKQTDSITVTVLPPNERAETIEFCPGDSVFIGGISYTQPGTVTNTIPGVGDDCDTVVTYTLVFDISFLKTFGDPDKDEGALGICDAKDGNLYVSSYLGGDSLAIIKMTPAGDIIWTDRINFINGRVEYIAEMFVDDEGMLAGCGTFTDFQYGFTFRYDPAAHTLLWAREIIFLDNHILGLVQKPNTGDYRLYLNFPVPFVGGGRAVQWDISKTTGSSVLGTAAEYQVDTSDWINSMVVYQDKIYGCGTSYFQGFGAAGKRHSLMRFDLNGQVEWARLGPTDQNTVQSFTGSDLIIDNDHIISIFSGNDSGTNLDNTTIFLQKNTLNGDVEWIRKFNLGDNFGTETAEEVVSVADGYVIMGHNRTGPGDLFFLKTDKEGHLVWAKKLDIADDKLAGFGSEQSQLLAFDNGLYFAAMTQNAAGKSDMLVGRMNQQGEIGVDCGYIYPLNTVETTVNPIHNTPVNLVKLSHGSTGVPLQIPPVPASTSLLANTACSGCESPGCDTVYLAQTLEFCPGDIVQIGGEEYDQPGIVLDTLPGSGTGCDTIVTYTLQFYQNSIVQIQCPADVSVEAAAGANSAVVNYNLPTANTDCPCSQATAELLQGLASGGDFPVGITQVCYEASDACGGANSCCFTVTVQAAPPEEACDVKITPCVKFEILGISQDPAGRKTYRMRVTSTCANKLMYVAFQLPNGIVAYSPATNTTYTAPSGRAYEVRNPNYSPTYSIRFKAIGDGIANGESDIFEYTLPPQADPQHIYAVVRLSPKIFYETHLNVFDCEVQQTSKPPVPNEDRQADAGGAPVEFAVFPNPASDVLFVQLPSEWSEKQIQLRVTDAYGRQLFHQTATAETNLLPLELPIDWPTGIYYLEAINEQGERQTGRFVRAAQR